MPSAERRSSSQPFHCNTLYVTIIAVNRNGTVLREVPGIENVNFAEV